MASPLFSLRVVAFVFFLSFFVPQGISPFHCLFVLVSLHGLSFAIPLPCNTFIVNVDSSVNSKYRTGYVYYLCEPTEQIDSFTELQCSRIYKNRIATAIQQVD